MERELIELSVASLQSSKLFRYIIYLLGYVLTDILREENCGLYTFLRVSEVDGLANRIIVRKIDVKLYFIVIPSILDQFHQTSFIDTRWQILEIEQVSKLYFFNKKIHYFYSNAGTHSKCRIFTVLNSTF